MFGVEMALAAEARVGVQLRHGHVQAGKPVGVHRALHVALENADANAWQIGDHPFEQCRLAGARRAHEVDNRHAGRSKSARLAWAIVLLASSASSTILTFVRCIAASSISIDSTSNSFPLAT